MLYEPRSVWGSSQSDPAGRPVGIQDEVVVHHTWKPHIGADVSASHERSIVRGIQDYHVRKGWDDIGYSFLVFQSRRAYEGRGWFRTGAHAKGANDKPSICFVINGDLHVPTEAAWNTAQALCADGVKVGALTPDFRVTGHHDYSDKSCPGVRTYPLIGRLRETLPRLAGGMEEDMLSQDDEGADVKYVQENVNRVLTGRHDTGPLTPDGVFGPLTVRAVKQAQAELGWPETGDVSEFFSDRMLHVILYRDIQRLAVPGPEGPAGPPGPRGPRGPEGPSGTVNVTVNGEQVSP